ncbi:MAG: dipeptide epimerase [Sphingomonadales bacterium]
MTQRTLEIVKEAFSLARPFRISRGVKHSAHLIRATVREGAFKGEGECCPYNRYGETIDKVLKTLEDVRQGIEQGLDCTRLQSLLPPGAARNALDCAFWDLEAQQTGKPVFARLGLPQILEFTTFRTVGITTPEKMGLEAASYPVGSPLKIKLGQELVAERLGAIRNAAPESTLMVDANEGWTAEFLADVMPTLKKLGVVLIEQPLPVKDDEALRSISRTVPILADEACHTLSDLAGLKGKYDAINIKLDKTGGLTQAKSLMNMAKTGGFKIMLGCMVSSSLSIAPISHLCSDADFIDLDGPLLLKADPYQGLIEVKDAAMVKITHPWGRIRV